jgi:hypothetical protein
MLDSCHSNLTASVTLSMLLVLQPPLSRRLQCCCCLLSHDQVGVISKLSQQLPPHRLRTRVLQSSSNRHTDDKTWHNSTDKLTTHEKLPTAPCQPTHSELVFVS